MPTNKKEEVKKKGEKAFGKTIRPDGNVALTVLCDPETDSDILEYFEKNTAVTYIAKEAIRQWMRDQEKRHTPLSEQNQVAELVQALLSNTDTPNKSTVGFTEPKEEPKAELSDEAAQGLKNIKSIF